MRTSGAGYTPSQSVTKAHAHSATSPARERAGSSGLMATPTAGDMARPELADDIEKYYQSATLMGHDRVQLFRLAWDLACSSFGGRQVLYERFFAGDPYLAIGVYVAANDAAYFEVFPNANLQRTMSVIGTSLAVGMR